jgi:hypothetical protein
MVAIAEVVVVVVVFVPSFYAMIPIGRTCCIDSICCAYMVTNFDESDFKVNALSAQRLKNNHGDLTLRFAFCFLKKILPISLTSSTRYFIESKIDSNFLRTGTSVYR